jgi:hypothetical protein
MICWLWNIEAREKNHWKQIELNDEGIERRKSNGLVATGFLGAATLKLPR